MLLSMAMLVTTPPSCIRLPPDPPPSSCLNVPFESLSPVIPPEPPDPPDVTLLPMLLSSHRSSAHHVPFRAGFHHAVAVSSTLPLVPVACVSSWPHRIWSFSPLRLYASPARSHTCYATASWTSHYRTSSCLNSLLIVALEVLVKPHYIFNVVDIVIYSLLDSHSPSILVNAKSSQLGLCFLYGHGASHQKLLSVIIPTVAYRCINVVFDYQFALGKKMKFLHGTLYTAELDSPFESSIFQCFVMLFIIIPPSSMVPGSSTLIVNFVAL
ncbi:hypothetical protein Bca52824_005936 [Brassica carinata]|uniref:Uncharacterized protein n=1 Tax=Brassica carinata TaxID=52824 RepID=A0A8X7WR41_BRACI|nr:hypothetical protein Bca52824_005936 [Brassica carinata]